MRIGVSSYSFYNWTKDGSQTLLDVIQQAREMGFEILEFAGLEVPDGMNAEEYAAKIKAECDRIGIEVGNYAIGADFINGSGGNPDMEVERLKNEVRIAGILGAKSLRHDAAWGFPAGYQGPKGFDDALPVLIKGCRAVTEYAHEFGIRTMVENHGFFCQDSERVEKLVNGVGHHNFGVLVDIGNFLCADEDPAKAVGRLLPYIFHVHAKDFHTKPGTGPNPGTGWFRSRGGNYLRGSIIGHGDVPVTQCLSMIENSGYEGSVSIEFEGIEDPLKGIAIGFENMKRFIG